MEFSKEEGKRVATLSTDILELKQAILSRIEKVESALREAEELSTREFQKCEALRQEAETRAASLESQLEENEEQLREKETTMEQVEESLNAEIQDLEDQINEKEKLIEARDAELNNLKIQKVTDPQPQDGSAGTEGETLAQIMALQEQLQAKEKIHEELQAELTGLKEQATTDPQDSSKDMELGLMAKICDLEQQLKERDERLGAQGADSSSFKLPPDDQTINLDHDVQETGTEQRDERDERVRTQLRELQERLQEKEQLLEERGMEIADLKRQYEVDSRKMDMDPEFKEREEDLRAREANMQQLEESLNSEIHDLDDRLNEKETLLQASQVELNDLREKMSAIGASPQGFLILKEEDVVVPDGPKDKENKDVDGPPLPIGLVEDMSTMEDDVEGLKAGFREQEARLAAKDIEIKMMKQVMHEKIKELEKVVKKEENRKPGKSRLVSFLANIERRH